MTKSKKITREAVLKYLDYDPNSGHFRWKLRTDDMFDADGSKRKHKHTCANWNSAWAGIVVSGQHKHLGTFDTVHEADAAYRAAEKHFRGEFARII